MQFPVVSFLLSLLFAFCNCQERFVPTRNRNSTGCLTRFVNDPGHFAPCLKEVCFLFRGENPYVELDPTMAGERDQKLFRCRDPSTYFPRLSGIAFEIFKELKGPDYWCVWTGHDCMFNNMVDFVEMQAEQTKHQFAITSILLETPERVSRNLHPSSPFMDSKMIVLGRRTDSDVAGTLDQLTKAFKKETWVVIIVVFLVYLVLIVSHVLVFCPRPLSFMNVFFHFMGNHSEDISVIENFDRTEDRRAWSNLYISSLWFLKMVMVTSLLLIVTFYELAAVNYLFIQNAKKLGKSVSNLSDAERKKYAVLKASAVEYIWMKSIGANENDTKVWYRFDDEGKAVEKVQDKGHPAQFIFTADLLIRYRLRKRQQCEALSIYETEDRMYQCGAGWLFGGRVPEPVRIFINKEILGFRLEGKVEKIVERVIGGAAEFQCGQDINSIGPAILGLPLAILVVPLFLPLVWLIFWGLYRWYVR